jgi:ribosomal protein S20
MNTAKKDVLSLIEMLPDECTIEDIQYHLYVVEKIQKGIYRAKTEGTLSQNEVERKFSRWTSQQTGLRKLLKTQCH